MMPNDYENRIRKLERELTAYRKAMPIINGEVVVKQPMRTQGMFTVGKAIIRSGTGTPEGVVTAPIGAMFLRLDGGAGTTLYMKESGTGNTGWSTTA